LSGGVGRSHGQIAAGREHHDRQKGQAGFHRFPLGQWLIKIPQAVCLPAWPADYGPAIRTWEPGIVSIFQASNEETRYEYR
jgi:hypothetical protein